MKFRIFFIAMAVLFTCPAVAQETDEPEQITLTATAEAPVIIRQIPARVDLHGIRRDIANIRLAQSRLRQQPGLTNKERELLSQMAQIDRLIPKLERLKDGEPITYLTRDEQAAVASIETLRRALEAEQGWQNRDWGFLSGIMLLFTILGGMAIIGIKFRHWVVLQLKDIAGRLTDVENRFDVHISNIDKGPHRTLDPSEIRQMMVGQKFDYYLKIDGRIAKYAMAIVEVTDSGKDVRIVSEFFNRGVPSRKLRKTLFALIEENGGMHPYVALAA